MQDAGDEDLGRRAEVLTKLVDQLSDKLALERRANEELRVLGTDSGAGARHRGAARLGFAATAAAVVFAGTLAVAGALRSVEPPTGALWITSTPPGARVRLDGRDQPGRTPMRVEDLTAARPVSVIVWSDGFAPWSRDVTVTEGRTKTIVASLQREQWPTSTR